MSVVLTYLLFDDKIRYKNPQYNINRKAALSSRKIDKYEYLSCKEILTSGQRRMIEQAKFTHSLLGKAF